MNLIIVRSDGTWYTRPDTTLEREAEDFYLPDGYSGVSAVEFLFVKIKKAGKAVGEKFADRYIGGCGRGVALYGEPGNSPYLDGSTVLLSEGETAADIPSEAYSEIVKALCNITLTMSVRIGDLLILESGVRSQVSRGGALPDFSIL